MVVGYDIAVLADNNAAAATLLFPGTGLIVLVAEEETEEGVDGLVHGPALHRHLHIYNGLHGILGCIGEIRIVRICQIDSTVFHSISFAVTYQAGGFGFRSPDHRIGSESASQNRQQHS